MRPTVPIKNSAELGRLVRTARKQQRLRQDEVGRFSHSFIGELEMGKPTAQLGKVLDALRELGLTVHVELPSGLDPAAFQRALSATR